MGRVETFDHTADLGLRIKGDDLADLFRTAAAGLFDVIVANRDQVQVVETEPVFLEAESTEDMLIRWLNELIFRSETQHRLSGGSMSCWTTRAVASMGRSAASRSTAAATSWTMRSRRRPAMD